MVLPIEQWGWFVISVGLIIVFVQDIFTVNMGHSAHHFVNTSDSFCLEHIHKNNDN